MNAVEIEEAVSALAEQPFDGNEFPFAFLEAFGNKTTTIKKLRKGASNKSDVGGVLQTGNIHIKVCEPGTVAETLQALKDSPATKTTRNRVKFILATDGLDLHAEDLNSGEVVVCPYPDFHNHFGFFLPLAGITTVQQIRESAFDIKATGRLNKLYIELLKQNPDWGTAERRHDLNHFMARLIFCFFAEDTGIFNGADQFTATVQQMSDRDASNTHEVIREICRAMNVRVRDDAGRQTARFRREAGIPSWANVFPYVNGELFDGAIEVPRFSRVALGYLRHIGGLPWDQINPDIFGSMIQAVADDEERGALGMHYTSVPNILKVLNPLFLDDLREQLDEAGDNGRKLLNLRRRMARVRVFDPACGSGNFLVIAYKQMREIEAEINRRRGEPDRKSDIPLTNFRGIEIRDFAAEIARLALIIAEYQSDVLYRGQKEALAEFLPLDAENWITCGNALRLDWLSICPPTGTSAKTRSDDLLQEPLDQPEIDFENEGGETFICGNPPYLGSTWQSAEQKSDLGSVFRHRTKGWKSLDYVAGWFMKAVDFGAHTRSSVAFVATNSICQGQQVPLLWPLVFEAGHEISFAHTSFRWTNLASHNAGVTVAIIGISNHVGAVRQLYSQNELRETALKEVSNINAYLAAASNVVVGKSRKPMTSVASMNFGNKPVDGGNLLLSADEVRALDLDDEQRARFVRRIFGSAEFIRGQVRHALWIEDRHVEEALAFPMLRKRVENVRSMRLTSKKEATVELADKPHRFGEVRQTGTETITIVPSVSSENRNFLPCGYEPPGTIASNLAFAIYDAPLWNMALVASRVHLIWIATVCGKLKTDYRYSNTLGWNTFPVPKLIEKNKEDLIRCAEDILLAREAHWPATIAELYDPEKMPDDLRAAHDRNDEVLERIYVGRRFRNDTERLEKLFEMYAKMTEKGAA
jgi:hypothetical protein